MQKSQSSQFKKFLEVDIYSIFTTWRGTDNVLIIVCYVTVYIPYISVYKVIHI